MLEIFANILVIWRYAFQIIYTSIVIWYLQKFF